MRTKKRVLWPVLLLGLSVVLLLLSAVGSARAALTYYSENYAMEVTVSSIGVTLVENGEDVSYRNYIEDDWSDSGSGELLLGLLEETNGKLIPGRNYREAIAVKNSGAIDSYVRVILYRSWQDAEGEKDTELSPELIDMGLSDGNGWVIDTKASTPERMVLYYTKVLPVGASTPTLCETLRIHPDIFQKVTEERTAVEGGEKITATYQYDGYFMSLEAEVDAVQTHSGREAIKSAWGVDVVIAEDGTLTLAQ